MATTKREVKHISNIEAARYYLKCEFAHIFPEQAESLCEPIDKLRDNQVWRLCEALSIFYRLNSVWWVVNNRSFKWTIETIPVDQVILTGVGDNPLDKLIHSDEIKRQSLSLKEFLLNYYAKSPDDPKSYDAKPSQRPIRWTQVMLAEVKSGLRLIDGSHRFIEQLLRGAEEIEAYVARPTRPVETIAATGGRGVIRLLDKLDESLPRESAAIDTISEALAKQSMFKDEFTHRTRKDSAHD